MGYMVPNRLPTIRLMQEEPPSSPPPILLSGSIHPCKVRREIIKLRQKVAIIKKAIKNTNDKMSEDKWSEENNLDAANCCKLRKKFKKITLPVPGKTKCTGTKLSGGGKSLADSSGEQGQEEEVAAKDE